MPGEASARRTGSDRPDAPSTKAPLRARPSDPPRPVGAAGPDGLDGVSTVPSALAVGGAGGVFAETHSTIRSLRARIV